MKRCRAHVAEQEIRHSQSAITAEYSTAVIWPCSDCERYRELFRQEMADTVADPGEVESELRFLAAALTRH